MQTSSLKQQSLPPGKAARRSRKGKAAPGFEVPPRREAVERFQAEWIKDISALVFGLPAFSVLASLFFQNQGLQIF